MKDFELQQLLTLVNRQTQILSEVCDMLYEMKHEQSRQQEQNNQNVQKILESVL